MQQQNRNLVEEQKAFCTKERERIQSRHRFGIGGQEIVEEYTRLADHVIQRIYQSAIQAKSGSPLLTEETPVAILALGGYGREELNPYSDIDIMLVYEASQGSAKRLEPFAGQLIATLWDVGFEVGHSCRSLKECVRASYDDIFSKTSMIEARYIVGVKSVYRQFQKLTSKHVFKKQVGKFIAKKVQEWSERHESYGSTIYLQEPNIKESVGGLRDFHTGIWVAAARYGIKELEGLYKRGIIPKALADGCQASLDFLWRLRNELHYVNRRRSDQLTFEVQETVAKNLGYGDNEDVLAEEFMMRDYYLHAEQLYEFAKLIIDRVKYRESTLRRLLDRWQTQTLTDGFAIVRNEVNFQHGHSDFAEDATRLMEVFVHRQRLGNRISADVRHEITANLDLIDDNFRRSPGVAECFLSILRHPKAVAETLRRMHRWQVLDRYLPEFGKVRSLVRFDRYHQYTVDEHTLYALENLEEATLAKLEDGQTFLNIIREVEKPELLRLAILLHDVGKGVEGPGGHDARGVEMARVALDRLGLDAVDGEVVMFLIHRHLDMSHTAQQRDLDDPQVIERFAGLVKDEQHLKMLYLLTFADMRAVSLAIWNEWNAILLWQLYSRTLKFLQGKVERLDVEELQKRVMEIIRDAVGEAAIAHHFETMPEQGLRSQTPEFISKQIQLAEQLGGRPIAVSCFAESQTYMQIGICTHDARGIFRRITGVLAAENINILSAAIDTRSDGIVIDVLNVTDGQTGNGAIPERCRQVEKSLTAVWEGETDVESLMRQQRKPDFPAHIQRRYMPPEIEIDNESSDYATIIDIRVQDAVGLLYIISTAFYELGLDIRLAKITTEAFTAVDSFYITDASGEKITDATHLEEIREMLAQLEFFKPPADVVWASQLGRNGLR
ncbi:MAG: [protein-PII] uridylyltransferase [Candidatus Poribacteria bacterium]|nr:[protein-PII] uridylyltransferase [Candidatus Poribacteria bacterium]